MLTLATVAGLLAVPTGCSVRADEAAKKLIEFGWDEPDTGFMRQHAAEMEATPFDGCVFHINYTKPDGQVANFCWECWGSKAFTYAELRHAVDDLRAAGFRRMTHHFVRFNVCPGDVNWFDDQAFAAVVNNAALTARIAREAGLPGVLLDIEQYNTQLWDYGQQPQKETRPWGEYAAQVRVRGAQVMEAFQSAYPDLVIFTSFGYCLPWYQTGGERPLAEANYGLLAPFYDGMLEAWNGRSRLVDGHEASYPYRRYTQFREAYAVMSDKALAVCARPDVYREAFSFGFGIWMDMDWRNRGWDTTDLSRNYFSPEAFGRSLRYALRLSDEYVWVYTETPRWWSAEGTPKDLPEAYWRSVAGAAPR